MKNHPQDPHFRKRVFTNVANTSLHALEEEKKKPHKKIIASAKSDSLRDQFKQRFLPLLIDVFELRQKIKNYRSTPDSPLFFIIEKHHKNPIEILNRLQELQNDIEETQRWFEGIIPQISKGIEEAKEALQLIDMKEENGCKPDISPEKKQGLLKRLLKS